MRRIALVGLLTIGLNALAQGDLNNDYRTEKRGAEIFSGLISGIVKTTDNQPAAYVTVALKENGIITFTNEKGFFSLTGLKEGTYTLQVSETGLKPEERVVRLQKDAKAFVEITLFENAKQLSEVLITAGRRLNNKPVSIGKIEVNPMDLPQSLTIVGAGLIKEQQAQRLSDVLKNVNGAYLTTTRGAVQESFGARGYSFGSTNLFKNGSRINSGSMPEMSSLEKVEVLKGSAAVLYGQVAPGGILNMVTKQPKFTAGGDVSMRAGSDDLYKPAIDFYGPLSSAIAYRINGTYESAGSFRDGVSSTRYYVNPSLVFKPGERSEILLEADYLYHRFTPDFGIGTLDGMRIPTVPRSRFMGTSWQHNKTNQATATATLKHTFTDAWKLNTSLSYQRYKRDYYATERVQAAANGDWTRTLGKIFTTDDYYTGQINLIGNFSTAAIRHNFLAGVDADKDVTMNNDFSFPSVAGLPAGSYDKINILNPAKYVQRTDIPVATTVRKRNAPVNRAGVYVQDLVKISPQLNVLAGLRWSYVETVGIDSTSLISGAETKGRTRFDNALSPRLGLVYKPFETTSFFVSYSNSFTVNSGQDMNGNAVAPSLIDQYEAGVKNEFWNGRLSANLTVYRIQNNNLAQTAPYLLDGTPNNNSNIKMLSGQTKSDGVELDLAGQPLKNLQVTAGYSYNFMRYTKTDTTIGSFKTGERLVSNPAHTANLSAFYTLGEGVLKGLKAGVTVAYIGERFAGWNTDVVSVNPLTYRTRIFTVGSFTTVDVSIGYSLKKLSLLAKVSNLTNALNYYVHENYSVNPIAPTQFVTTVAYRW